MSAGTKKVLLALFILFVGVSIFTRPEGFAQDVNNAWDILMTILVSIVTFIGHLSF